MCGVVRQRILPNFLQKAYSVAKNFVWSPMFSNLRSVNKNCTKNKKCQTLTIRFSWGKFESFFDIGMWVSSSKSYLRKICLPFSKECFQHTNCKNCPKVHRKYLKNDEKNEFFVSLEVCLKRF